MKLKYILNMKTVGIAYSKHRNAIGMVGNEVNIKEKKVRIKLAREWSRKDIGQGPSANIRIIR